MKLSNLYGIVLTFADDLFIGDIPINEETKYYGHMLRDGDQIIFTFSDVYVNIPAKPSSQPEHLAQYVGGVSARIYVKHLGGKKFKMSCSIYVMLMFGITDLERRLIKETSKNLNVVLPNILLMVCFKLISLQRLPIFCLI